MSQGQHSVILVYSTGHAIKAEKALVKAGIRCKLIPVPRQISSNCGVEEIPELADFVFGEGWAVTGEISTGRMRTGSSEVRSTLLMAESGSSISIVG